MAKLLKIDDLARNDHYYLTLNDSCYYLREYTSNVGFNFGETNNLISNFKKSPLFKLETQYRYKTRAIAQIASELSQAIPSSLLSQTTFVPIPPSKAKNHPEYDDRIRQVLDQFHSGALGKDVRELLSQRESTRASHECSDRLHPDELRALYSVDLEGLRASRGTICLFDDLLTTGSHFRAAKDSILNVLPDVQVVGVFVARRIFPSPEVVDPDEC